MTGRVVLKDMCPPLRHRFAMPPLPRREEGGTRIVPRPPSSVLGASYKKFCNITDGFPPPFEEKVAAEGRRRGGFGLLAWLCALTLSFAAPAFADERIAPVQDVPRMVEEAAEAGIEHVYDGPWEYFVGGGVAVFDCSGDRRPDLVLAGGKGPVRLFVNHSPVGSALRFEEKPLGLSERDKAKVTGVYALDIDGDGIRDLVLTRVGRNLVLRGEPDCTFAKSNQMWGIDGGREWTTGLAATWEEGAAMPTLAFANYVDRSAPGSPWGTCSDNVLLRPGTDGRYGEPIALTPGHCALSVLFTDWNRSGIASLRFANDRHYYRGGEEQLWRVEPSRRPQLYRAADGWKTLRIWGMGIAEGDLEGDGFPEYAITSMGDTKLQALDEEAEEDRPTYRDLAWERGATAQRPYRGGEIKPSTGWHAEFADLNNDARLDLFIAKGNVEAMPDFAANDPDNLLLGGFDGRFTEAGDHAGLDLETKGRGGAVVDLNMDGLLDLVVVNRGQPTSVFRNMGGASSGEATRPMGNWLKVELEQDGANPDAVGASLSVRTGNLTQTRTVRVGGGHASSQAGFEHIGLGTAERAELRVRWPDGEWSAPMRVFADTHVIVRRGEDVPALWFGVDDGDAGK